MVGIHNLYWYYGSHYLMNQNVAKSTAELFEKYDYCYCGCTNA